jgi:CspA family cold shock protein
MTKSKSRTGSVRFFTPERGFGFITPDDGGDDVFVHISVVEQSGLGYLQPDQRVEFTTEVDARGPKAMTLAGA